MSEAARTSKTPKPPKSKPSKKPAPDLTGSVKGGIHRLLVRVYYEDTDALGMVYYANYLKYLERGRTDMLRLMAIGRHDPETEDGRDLFVVRHCAVDFLAPAKLDDVVEVRTSLAGVGGAVLELDQAVIRDGKTLVSARIKAACVDSEGKPRRLSPKIRQKLHDLLTAKQQKAGTNA